MMRATRVSLYLCVSVMALACGPSADDSPATSDRRIRAATLSQVTRKWAGLGLRLGSLEGDNSVAFGHISDFAMGTSGQYFVADVLANTVFVFDSTGRLERQIGQPGEGPGEFQGRLTVHAGRGDTLRVFDHSLWRETLFDGAGNLVGTDSPPRPLVDIGQIPELRYDDAGILYHLNYDEFRRSLTEAIGGRSEGVARGVVWIDRWDKTQNVWKHVIQVPSLEVRFSGGGLEDQPYGRRPLWTVSPSGDVWYADSGIYTIHKFDGRGDPIFNVLVEVEHALVTEREREAFYQASDRPDLSPDRRVTLRRRRESIVLPKYRPTLRRLVSSRQGGLWVQVDEESRGGDHEVEWHVYTSDGRLDAIIGLPARLKVMSVDDNRVIGIERDDLGVEYVARYDLGVR